MNSLSAGDGRGTPHLTNRERQVLVLVGDALTRVEIASRLGIRVKTLDHYLDSLKLKLGVRRTAELIRLALLSPPR